MHPEILGNHKQKKKNVELAYLKFSQTFVNIKQERVVKYLIQLILKNANMSNLQTYVFIEKVFKREKSVTFLSPNTWKIRHT